MTVPYHYSVFGLTLASDFDFEVLEKADPPVAGPDVTVKRVIGMTRPTHPADPFFDITPDRQYLHWQAVAAFSIESPGLVLVEPHDGISDHLVSQAFLGLVISLVLERRGVLCLHASAVSVNGRAALFLGDKGAGKSTTSCAVQSRGHSPLTDDLVAVADAAGAVSAPFVQPGFSSMKLWPDSIAALALPEDADDRRVHPSVSKIQKRMPMEIANDPAPMGAIFLLRRSSETQAPKVFRLPPHLALQAVLRFTFMARYGESRLGPDHLVLHMKRCGGVVANVPVFDLHIPANLDLISDVAKTIEECMDQTRSHARM
ncbi:hypothetical protein [Marivita sp.]|uniref:hypothetical protein n=1 Tax=Marivita sp. TaxID=2003365 RepID=UPI0025C119BD|nr:hypothetical protein [Marivita sp.]